MRMPIRRLAALQRQDRDLFTGLAAAGDTGLKDALAKLGTRLNRALHPVTMEVMWPPESDATIATFLFQTPTRVRDVRVIFSEGESSQAPHLNGFLTSADCSHLVVVRHSASSPKWSGGQGPVVFLDCDRNLWPSVLVDVGLDIALFHSDRASRGYASNVLAKMEYSRHKAQFVAVRAPVLIGDPQPSYVPLGAVAREGVELNYDYLASLWTEFRSNLPDSKMTSLSETLRHQYPHPSQINADKIGRILDPLPAGQYVFVRACRRIKLTKVRDSIKFLFPDFQIGQITVRPLKDRAKLLGFAERGYIWMISFEKE